MDDIETIRARHDVWLGQDFECAACIHDDRGKLLAEVKRLNKLLSLCENALDCHEDEVERLREVISSGSSVR